VAAHHNMKKHWLLERQGYLEQGVVVDEGNVDSAGIVGVGVHHVIAPSRRQCRVHALQESVDDEAVFDLAHAQQVWPLAGVHRRDHRSKLIDLAIVPLIKIIWSIHRRRGAAHVLATVGGHDHQGLVSCADQVRPRDEGGRWRQRLKLQDHHLAMILIKRGPVRGPSEEWDA
jgi:hypothetical protein